MTCAHSIHQDGVVKVLQRTWCGRGRNPCVSCATSVRSGRGATFSAVVCLIALMTSASAGEVPIDAALLAAARVSMPGVTATNELVSILQGGLWNSNQTAVAVSVSRPEAQAIFVLFRQTNANYLAVDVSRVEAGNLGKLGLAGRAGYDRVETTPTRWVYREDGRFQVIMRTRAWRAGKRYTVSEPLLINADGTILWR